MNSNKSRWGWLDAVLAFVFFGEAVWAIMVFFDDNRPKLTNEVVYTFAMIGVIVLLGVIQLRRTRK